MGKRKQKTTNQDIYQQVTDSILASLREGVAPWTKPWDDKNVPAGWSLMPHNASTGRRYSGVNILLLWQAAAKRGYSDNRWLTFNQAKGMGGTIRKGEKGTKIVFAKKVTKTEENDDGEKEKRQFFLWKFWTVFNAEQTDGLELAEPLERPIGEAEPEKFLARSGAKINYGSPRAAYSPSFDYIQLPFLEAFDNEGSFLATGLHELVHWTGHGSRLDRDTLTGTDGFGGKVYAEEELVAELGAAFLCATYGVEGKLQHAEYIGNWIKKLEEDNRVVFRAARQATDASDYLAERLDAQEQEAVAA